MDQLFQLPRTVLPALRPRARLRQLPAPKVAPTGRRRFASLRGGTARAQYVAVALAFLAYSAVRFITRGDRATALDHGQQLLDLEQTLGVDWERQVQDAVIDNDAIRQFFTMFYAWGYWPAVAGTLLLLWRIDPLRVRVFRNALFLSGAAGLVVFAAYPAAPPRMLPGFTDTVAESGQHFVAHPSGFTNPYAALPSFHAGWFFLAAVVLAGATRRRGARALLWLVAPLMSVAVVVTANHYLVDVVLGVGLSLGALAIANRWSAARRSRNEDRRVATVFLPSTDLADEDSEVLVAA